MTESREIPLASLMRTFTEGRVELTIEEGSELVFFELNGHKFCTFGTNVYHDKHPLFGSTALAAMAKHHDTAEEAEDNRLFNERFERFMEFRGQLMERLFSAALKVLAVGGQEAFLKYVDTYLDITEREESCQGILKLLEKGKKI